MGTLLLKKYIRNAGAEQYRVVYDLNHPKRQNELERNLMCSPFFERQQQLGGHFFSNLIGFERAHWYESNRHLLLLFLEWMRTFFG